MRRTVTSMLSWLLPLLALAAALPLRTPLLFKHRYGLLLTICLLAALYAAARLRPRLLPRWLPRPRRLPALLALAAAVFALGQEASFHHTRRTVLAAEPARLQRVGRHVMVGYRHAAEVEPLVTRGAVAGLYVTTHNLRGRSAADLAAELDRFARLRRARGLPPLLVAADQEGGEVSRLSPPLTALPPLSRLVARASDRADLERRVRRYAAIHGRELKRLGININFGPVVDLSLDTDTGALDLHSKIRKRAIAADPRIVSRVARVYSATLARHGVLPTLKHFPGLGRVSADTHYFTAALDRSVDQLRASDWRPFRAVSRATPEALIMLAHVKLPALDPDHLASCSRAVATDLLRTRWGHRGLLITDDFTMLPVWHAPGGLAAAVVRALNAGVDLILISADTQQVYPALAALLAADRAGALDATALAESRARLASL